MKKFHSSHNKKINILINSQVVPPKLQYYTKYTYLKIQHVPTCSGWKMLSIYVAHVMTNCKLKVVNILCLYIN